MKFELVQFSRCRCCFDAFGRYPVFLVCSVWQRCKVVWSLVDCSCERMLFDVFLTYRCLRRLKSVVSQHREAWAIHFTSIQCRFLPPRFGNVWDMMSIQLGLPLQTPSKYCKHSQTILEDIRVRGFSLCSCYFPKDFILRGEKPMRRSSDNAACFGACHQVHWAKGIRPADVNGLADPFCVPWRFPDFPSPLKTGGTERRRLFVAGGGDRWKAGHQSPYARAAAHLAAWRWGDGVGWKVWKAYTYIDMSLANFCPRKRWKGGKRFVWLYFKW